MKSWFLVGVGATLAVIVVVATVVPLAIATVERVQVSNIAQARGLLEDNGYVVLNAGEYETINAKLDAIKVSADLAVTHAEAAVVEAANAVAVAGIAAAKVDLFNSAEVFLFPSTTNVTVTLTAGNTNQFGAWAEITDGATTLSSKFAANPGYISDMYIYDHSAVDKLYLVEIAYGDNKTTLARVMYHTSFIEMAPVKSRLVPAGETIYYRMMCSGANGATAKVGFRYFYE